jgi:DNA-binding FrmR family transcriptional regulator
MQIDTEVLADVTSRLRRIEGQVGGLIRMIDDGRDCKDVITQLAATSKALDRAGFKILATGLTKCIAEPGAQSDRDREELEKLFLALA